MSGARFFAVEELNPYENKNNQPDLAKATVEFESVKAAIERAGIEVIKVDEPEGCQDGIYTANWGLCRGDVCVLSSLPNLRKAEEPYAEKILSGLGKKIIKPRLRFSGQGDALPCGNLLFAGSNYRTDAGMHEFLADTLGYEVVSLQTVPALAADGDPATNRLTGWPDKVRSVDIEKIEVTLDEAQNHFACNLISSGDTVVMGAHAPKLQAAIEARGLRVIPLDLPELAKGGGFIRCTTLTLDN